jgi:hypothetical protein
VSWRPPLRYQRKVWEARQCVTGFEFLESAPERVVNESLRANPKNQWRSQEVGDVRNADIC